jgi:hypothetical protein
LEKRIYGNDHSFNFKEKSRKWRTTPQRAIRGGSRARDGKAAARYSGGRSERERRSF